MIISDKQALRRCVKQAVRRADVVETMLDFDVLHGELGVEATLSAAGMAEQKMEPGTGAVTPLGGDAVAMFAALDALGFPVRDANRAGDMQRAYTREAYLREILDAMHARHVLVRTPLARAQEAQYEDDRFIPLLSVDGGAFVPGRYGVPYAQAAQDIRQAAQLCGARHVLLERYDEQAVRYCMLPVCEDTGMTLHVGLQTREEIACFTQALDGVPPVRALVFSPPALERELIACAAGRERMLVRLSSAANFSEAIARLGLRFIPFTAGAQQPELMLGRWIDAREMIWQALCAAYLPLARTGYDLSSEAIARDVQTLLCENALGRPI